MKRWKRVLYASLLVGWLASAASAGTLYSTVAPRERPWPPKDFFGEVLNLRWDRAAAWPFVAPEDATVDSVNVALVRYVRTWVAPGTDVTVSLVSDQEGLPGAPLQTVAGVVGPTLLPVHRLPVPPLQSVDKAMVVPRSAPDRVFSCCGPLTRATFPAPVPLTQGQTYWISVVPDADPETRVGWFASRQEQALQSGASTWGTHPTWHLFQAWPPPMARDDYNYGKPLGPEGRALSQQRDGKTEHCRPVFEVFEVTTP